MRRLLSVSFAVYVTVMTLVFSTEFVGSLRADDSDAQEDLPLTSVQLVPGSTRVSVWDRGIGLSSTLDARAFIYLRFYEWNLFDAVDKGEHSPGRDIWPWDETSDRQEATLESELCQAKVTAVDDGATIELTVTNITEHDWPETAAIIPCLSPEYVKWGVPDNPFFFDEVKRRTFYLGPQGLQLLQAREIHFHADLKPRILQRSGDGSGVFEKFSHKWPTSDDDAVDGLMVRESIDRTWVTGIAWSRFLSAQGHNPRKCMHLSVRVGPLKVGESRTVHGRIYLLPGTKEDCVKRFHNHFTSP